MTNNYYCKTLLEELTTNVNTILNNIMTSTNDVIEDVVITTSDVANGEGIVIYGDPNMPMPEVYIAEEPSTDGMPDFVNDADVENLA